MKLLLALPAILLLAACGQDDVNHTGKGVKHKHHLDSENVFFGRIWHTHECGDIPHSYEEHYALRKDCIKD